MRRLIERFPFGIFLVFLVFMAKNLQETNGQYSTPFTLALIVFFALVVAEILREPRRKPSWEGLSRTLAAIAVYFSLELAIRPQVHFNEYQPCLVSIRWILSFGVIFCVAIFASVRDRDLARRARQLPWLFGGAALCWLAAKILTVAGSPRPHIDVFTISSDAASDFLRGQDPYSRRYADIYGGQYDYPPIYGYWPGVLYLQAAFKGLVGDLRYSLIAADVATCVLLARIQGRLGFPLTMRLLVPLAWMYFPVTLHMLEMSWVDTYLVMMATLVLWALLGSRWVLAGLALGYFCTIKQYALFFGLLTVTFVYLRAGLRAALAHSAAAAAVFMAVVLPMALWDPAQFYASTIGMFMDIGMRLDSMSIPAALAHLTGLRLSGAVLSGFYGAALAAALTYLIRRGPKYHVWSGSLVIAYGMVFLMGKQSFLNYYLLLTYFVILTFVLRLAHIGRGDA